MTNSTIVSNQHIMDLYCSCCIVLPVLIFITILLYVYHSRPRPSISRVVSVSVSSSHDFAKSTTSSINLIQGLGVEGDVHLGTTVQHRSRLHIHPAPANLRQVHLIAVETLLAHGLRPGDIGDNIATEGIDLLALRRGARLRFVSEEGPKRPGSERLSLEHLEGKAPMEQKRDQDCPCVIVQGLRNPCPQIEKFRSGLQEQFIVRDDERKIVGRKAGVMGTVEVGGIVEPGMRIVIELPDERVPLECV